MGSLVNIFVLFPKQEQARSIRNLLVRNGFEVTAACVTGAQIMQRAESLEDGLVVCGYKFVDMVSSELREYLPAGFKMIVLAPQTNLEFFDLQGMEYLPMPLKPQLLMEKVRQMVDTMLARQKEKKHKPRQRTREELEIIEEVKVLLMKNNRITEQEAHEYIQRRSMNSGVGLIEMAKMIRDSYTY